MSDWNRTTKKLDIIDIQIDRQRAIYKHINSNNLGNPLGNAIMCVETVSEKKKGGGMGDSVLTCDAIITPAWLIWVTRGDKSDLSANSARLETLNVTDYADSPNYKLIPDSGLELTGVFTGRVGENGSLNVSAFIGLGEEPEAKAFKEAVFLALQKVKK